MQEGLGWSITSRNWRITTPRTHTLVIVTVKFMNDGADREHPAVGTPNDPQCGRSSLCMPSSALRVASNRRAQNWGRTSGSRSLKIGVVASVLIIANAHRSRGHPSRWGNVDKCGCPGTCGVEHRLLSGLVVLLLGNTVFVHCERRSLRQTFELPTRQSTVRAAWSCNNSYHRAPQRRCLRNDVHEQADPMAASWAASEVPYGGSPSLCAWSPLDVQTLYQYPSCTRHGIWWHDCCALTFGPPALGGSTNGRYMRVAAVLARHSVDYRWPPGHDP